MGSRSGFIVKKDGTAKADGSRRGGSSTVQWLIQGPEKATQKFIDEGDPYLDHVLCTVRGVMERFEERPWKLGFQSRTGPVQWMEPDTLEVLDQLGAEKAPGVLIVPISFVSDHIETLQEIDYEFRMHAEAIGLPRFERAPSLNDNTDFLQALAALVRSCLASQR